MAYTITLPNPPAVMTIRIQKAQNGEWLACPLLCVRPGWVQVDDGEGSLWVMIEHVHSGDWPKLSLFERLAAERN